MNPTARLRSSPAAAPASARRRRGPWPRRAPGSPSSTSAWSAPRRWRPRSAASRMQCDVSSAEAAPRPSPKRREQLGAAAHPGQLRRHRHRREDDRQGRPASARPVPQGDRGQSDRHLQHDPPGRRPRREARAARTAASAASSSTPRRSPPMTARSARPPIRRPRAASSA